jgi:hypothetical protein
MHILIVAKKALDGRVEAHHRLLLKQIVEHIDFLEQQIGQLLTEIEARMAPFPFSKEEPNS